MQRYAELEARPETGISLSEMLEDVYRNAVEALEEKKRPALPEE